MLGWDFLALDLASLSVASLPSMFECVHIYIHLFVICFLFFSFGGRGCVL